MKIKNAAHWCRLPRPVCYLIALGVFGAVFALRWSLHPVLGKIYPFQFFFLSSYIVTFMLGAGPGVLVMVLGLFTGSYYFVEPFGDFSPLDWNDSLYLGNYVLSSLLVIVTIEYLQRSRYQNELLLRVARSRYEMLLHRDNQRMLLQRTLGKTGSAS
jgi:K+-sensing histidine kinase KdpD